MYDRRYEDEVLSFEASGGLMNASLIMRDRETDSWWSIITSDAIGGYMEGKPLKEIPTGKKMQWGEWKALYPNTKVLTVNGVQHDPVNDYDNYFAGTRTFRGVTAQDNRLADKASVYAFIMNDVAYAVPHRKIEGGIVIELEGKGAAFFYRPPGSQMFATTFAYLAEDGQRFKKKGDMWVDAVTKREFSQDSGFAGGEASDSKATNPTPIDGFDTFWYIWSATHGKVELLD